MSLLLVDLDNTLIDRAGAFERWAQGFVAARGGDAGDAAWLVAADRDGLEPRERLAGMIASDSGWTRRTSERRSPSCGAASPVPCGRRTWRTRTACEPNRTAPP